MDQKIIYAIVIETDGKVVGEHDITKNSNLRETVVNTIYPRVPKNNHRRTLKHNASDFHYKCSDNRCYFAVADSNFKQRSVWAFLDEVEKEYLRISLAPNPTAVKKILKKQMEFFNDPSNDKIAVLQTKIEDIKADMIDNLDKVLERGEKLEVLVEKTEDVKNAASHFRKGTRKVKNRSMMKWLLLVIILLVILIVIIVALVFIICGASGCFKKK